MSDKQACPIAGLKNILLAVDGSGFSEAAMKQAINISKSCSCKLYVISVVEVNPEYEALAPKIVEKAESDTRQLLEWTKECIVKEGIECETIAHQGEEPAQFIIEEAEKRKADMIVMGSHGRKGLKKILMGSVTQKVLAHTPCSVLVVKA
ncbi:MAG: universal stress protein [Nitrospirae bacterium]|nr:universal stress protein [Nitrospirota bacterium]